MSRPPWVTSDKLLFFVVMALGFWALVVVVALGVAGYLR